MTYIKKIVYMCVCFTAMLPLVAEGLTDPTTGKISVIPNTETERIVSQDKTTAVKKNQDKKNETDIKKRFSAGQGDIVLDIFGELGTFGISARKAGTASVVPLLASYDGYSSTFFALNEDNTVFRLNSVSGIKSTAKNTDNGVAISYSVTNKAIVQVLMTFMATAPGKRVDMIRMDITTTNIDKKSHTFALKAVFDTVLGEESTTDFYTAVKKKIDSETVFESMKNDKWIVSGDSDNSIQFLLYGPGITVPKEVVLGNKDVLAFPPWEPSVVPNRSFDSVISYNNSALGINWPFVSLSSEASYTTTFYIVVATGGMTPTGGKFLTYLNQKSTSDGSVVPLAESPETDAVNQDHTVLQSQEEKLEDHPDVKFDVASIKQEQLDPAYIQNLLNRINALESTNSDINREELLKLNAELDAILAKLRQQ